MSGAYSYLAEKLLSIQIHRVFHMQKKKSKGKTGTSDSFSYTEGRPECFP